MLNLASTFWIFGQPLWRLHLLQNTRNHVWNWEKLWRFEYNLRWSYHCISAISQLTSNCLFAIRSSVEFVYQVSHCTQELEVLIWVTIHYCYFDYCFFDYSRYFGCFFLIVKNIEQIPIFYSNFFNLVLYLLCLLGYIVIGLWLMQDLKEASSL